MTRLPIHLLTTSDPEGARAIVFHGLLLPVEIGGLLALGQQAEQRATIQAANDTKIVSDDRSNSVAFVDNQHPLLQVIRARMAAFAGVPVSRLEPTQILHYRKGEQYKAHYDAFPKNSKELQNGGNRVGTILLYLNSVPKGGATTLPKLGLSVHPQPGLGLFFRSQNNGALIENSLHSGEPVTEGEKWAAVTWIRESDYQQK